MIHTASLVHDDVVDELFVAAFLRFIACLAIALQYWEISFAQSSWYLANLDNLEVVKLLSEVIMDLAGDPAGLKRFDTSLSIEAYLEKSYYKAASLIATVLKLPRCSATFLGKY